MASRARTVALRSILIEGSGGGGGGGGKGARIKEENLQAEILLCPNAI